MLQTGIFMSRVACPLTSGLEVGFLSNLALEWFTEAD